MYCMSKFKKGALIIVSAGLLYAACTPVKQQGLTDVDDNGGYASDGSRIEWANNDIISIADEAGTLYNGQYLSDGATVGTDTMSIPHTLTIRFGDNNSVCYDGRRRKGTIIVTYNNQYKNNKETHTITFDHYFIEGNEISGTILTTRIDTTISGNWYYNVQVDDSMNMSQDPLQSKFVKWSGNLVRKYISGYTTPDRKDDIFSISGSATLTRPSGHQFSFGISTPLQFALTCDYAESGVVNVTGYNGARILNYGDGNCDQDAKLNVGVNVYPISITK